MSPGTSGTCLCGVKIQTRKNKSSKCRSCAALDRWHSNTPEERRRNMAKAHEYSRRTRYYQRIIKEFKAVCGLLDLIPTKSLIKLYIQGRKTGYLRGYTACRMRKLRGKRD